MPKLKDPGNRRVVYNVAYEDKQGRGYHYLGSWVKTKEEADKWAKFCLNRYGDASRSKPKAWPNMKGMYDLHNIRVVQRDCLSSHIKDVA